MYYNKNSILFLNEEFIKATESGADLYGQTLHYGYGVFEGIRAYDTEVGTRIFKSKEHYDRLRKSCELINIPFHYTSEELEAITYTLLKKNNMTNGYIRPLVFCDPNMNLTRPNRVSLMICAWEWGAYLGDQQLRVMISSYCRPHPRSTKIEAKASGHYINSILASTEAKDKGYDEALLLDVEGYLAEGPGANFFFEKDGVLFTPQKGNILSGITRETIIEICKELGITVKEGLYTKKELDEADSAFFCGTAAEIIGIKSIDDKKFPLEWKDALGKKLHNHYSQVVRKPVNTLISDESIK